MVKASNWSQTFAVFLCLLVLSAAAPLEAQEPGGSGEPVVLVINADEALKKTVSEVILKELMRLPGIQVKVLGMGQQMRDYSWSVTIVVDETTIKDGSKSGSYVMAVAFSKLVAIFDGDKSLASFTAYECVPKSKFTRFILETRTGVSDLRSMVLWAGEIREGFAGPGSEIAEIFEREYLPEIRRQRLQKQIRGLPSTAKLPPG